MPARKVDGVWIVDTWVDVPGEGRRRLRKKSPIQNKKGAQDYERELVESVLSSCERREERRFDEFAIEFLERQIRVHCKYSTLVTYESALREHLVPTFGGQWLDEIKEREIAAFQAALTKKGRSPKTVRNIVTVLSSALHTAKVWGYLDRLPEIRMPKPAAARVRFLSLEECLRLEEASTSSWQLMIHFARKTGLRIGELCALEWEQLNLDNGTVLVDRAVWRKRVSSPKGNRSRIVELSPGLARVLSDHRGSGLVFPSRRGTRRQEHKCDVGLRRCAERADLQPLGWHVLRHTYASHLVMAGVALPVVQQLLGHTDIRLTMRYAHLSPGHRSSAVRALDVGQPLGRTRFLEEDETREVE